MLSPASQLLLRSSDMFEQGRWLLVNPEDSDIFQQLDGDVHGFHQYLGSYLPYTNHAKHQFGAVFASDLRFDGIVIYMPKSKEHAQMLLANMAAHLQPGGCLMLVGDNKSGVKSAAKLLQVYGDNPLKLDAARHCCLLNVVVAQTAAAFSLSDWAREFTVDVAGQSLHVYSMPGIFNHGKLDEGTRLLLENHKPIPTGPVLDFACGAGIIGAFLAKKNPAISLYMSDISAIALYCAEQTAALNAVKAELLASDGLQQIERKFAAIYTNPPFHTGTKTDYSITEQFLASANRHLGVNGSLTLVANAFLDYPPLMEKHVAAPLVLCHTSRFKLYHCQKK